MDTLWLGTLFGTISIPAPDEGQLTASYRAADWKILPADVWYWVSDEGDYPHVPPTILTT